MPIGSEQLRISSKDPCRVVQDSNVTLVGGAPLTVEGATLAQFDRVLVIGQTLGQQNGIYVVDIPGSGSNGTWSRARDADTSLKVRSGLEVWVSSGASYQQQRFILITANPIVLGTTALTFKQDKPQWSVQTLNATPTALPYEGSPTSFRLRSNSAVKFTMEVVARSSAGDVAGFRISGVAKRAGGVGTTTIVGYTVEPTGADPALATATVAPVADVSDGSIAPQATGVAATTINWKATMTFIAVG